MAIVIAGLLFVSRFCRRRRCRCWCPCVSCVFLRFLSPGCRVASIAALLMLFLHDGRVRWQRKRACVRAHVNIVHVEGARSVAVCAFFFRCTASPLRLQRSLRPLAEKQHIRCLLAGGGRECRQGGVTSPHGWTRRIRFN